MNDYKKQLIAFEIIKVLKMRFDSFPNKSTIARNAPFHKAFLAAFEEKLYSANTNPNALINLSSWMHGLNTTLGQSFFESVSHIVSDGAKKAFKGNKIYAEQSKIIYEIMADLKNSTYKPSLNREETLIYQGAHGDMIDAPDFTADCFYETEDKVVAIELKSVRPNSGEMRGEKQKILS